MLRYICENPKCLNTFLSPDLEVFKRCKLCGRPLLHVGKPEKQAEIDYPPPETKGELKTKYVKLHEKSLRIGLLPSEIRTVGRAIRKIPFKERKKLLKEHGLWKEGIIYKHVMTDGGLLKMVIDKSAMYDKKKKENLNK